MTRAMRWVAASTAVALCAMVLPAQPSNLARRIDAVRDGTVRLQFAARPDVCADGRGSVWIRGRGAWVDDERPICINGPIVVRIGRDGNETVSIRKWIGGGWRPSSTDLDLGEVSAIDAARYLIGIAHGIGGNNVGEALSAAVFADGGDIASELGALVRDRNAPLEARRQGLFWLGQSDAPTSQLIALDGALAPHTLREHYTFVLSQRRDAPAVDKLMALARDDRDADIRKQALFWLGQSKDPRARSFIRDLILR